MRHRLGGSKGGFTLIEVIVVGLLAALLGVGLIQMLYWLFSGSRHEQQVAHLQAQANIVGEEIARHVHVSTTIATAADSSSLEFYTGGTLRHKLSISGDTLYERKNSVQVPFRVAGQPVLVKGDSSYFVADITGDFLLDMRLLIKRGDSAYYSLRTGNLRCRN